MSTPKNRTINKKCMHISNSSNLIIHCITIILNDNGYVMFVMVNSVGQEYLSYH